MWDYQEEYEKLLETLAKDSRPWRPVFNIPADGTKIYFKLGNKLTKDCEFRYDVGYWDDYTKRDWYEEGTLEGEFNTEFGNLDWFIVGWKEV